MSGNAQGMRIEPLYYSGIGALPADRHRRPDRRPAGGFLPRAIRSRSRPRHFFCRRGAPAGSRARSFSTSSPPTPRFSRASSRSATSTRTRLAFAEAATGGIAAQALDLPPALGGLERRVLLARLVLQWAASPEMRAQRGAPLVASSPAAALALADDLARLIDDMMTRQVSWDRLDGLVPDHVDEYWQLTLKFLKIARQAWPAILDERGAIEPAARRDRLIAAEAARLAQAEGPVIAAGSTGSMPATAALLATIARLPHGAVVLPGLDTDLDERIVGAGRREDAPAFGHPQFAMHALLRRLGTTRDEVTVLGAASTAASGSPPKPCVRRRRPNAGRRGLPMRSSPRTSTAPSPRSASSKLPMPRRKRSPSRSRCAKRWKRRRRAPRSSRPIGGSPVAWLRRSRAGKWRSTIPAVMCWPTPRPAFRTACRRSGARRPSPVRCSRSSSIRCCVWAGARARMTGRLRRWNGRCCAGRGRGPAPPGLRKRWRPCGRTAELHPSDPRATLAEWELDAASDFVGRLGAALAPLENLGRTVRPFADLAARHREVVAELSDSAALAEADGVALARAFDGHRAAPAAAFDLAPSDYARAVPGRPRRPWCAGRAWRRACASSVCSKRGCRRSTAWCWAAWSRAPGRRRRAATPGSAGRCGTSSASIFRSAASG